MLCRKCSIDLRAFPLTDAKTLLGHHDPVATLITNPGGASDLLLLGDHAGKLVPRSLDQLGLPEAELSRHIGIDIGVSALGRTLAGLLDACFIEQRYSRLVVDCNRHPDAADAIAQVSDGTHVPGNCQLTQAQRARRFTEIHEPYHRAIADHLAARARAKRGTVLVSLHSFTRSMNGFARPWSLGVLHGEGNTAFAQSMLAALRDTGLTIGDNEPYRLDAKDYTVPRHAFPALPYVELEVSQGLLGDQPGIAAMADVVAAALTRALGTA